MSGGGRYAGDSGDSGWSCLCGGDHLNGWKDDMIPSDESNNYVVRLSSGDCWTDGDRFFCQIDRLFLPSVSLPSDTSVVPRDVLQTNLNFPQTVECFVLHSIIPLPQKVLWKRRIIPFRGIQISSPESLNDIVWVSLLSMTVTLRLNFSFSLGVFGAKCCPAI